MSESLNMFQGLQIAIYGFLTVFIMLSVLMFLIMLMSKIVIMISGKKEEEHDSAKVTTTTVITPVVEEESKPKDTEFTGEIELIDVDEKTAACIMAIISEETKIPLDHLIFKRIELMKEDN